MKSLPRALTRGILCFALSAFPSSAQTKKEEPTKNLPVLRTLEAGGQIDYYSLTNHGQTLVVCIEGGKSIRLIDLKKVAWAGELPASDLPRRVATNAEAIFATGAPNELVRYNASDLTESKRITLPSPVSVLRAVPGSTTAPVTAQLAAQVAHVFRPDNLERVPGGSETFQIPTRHRSRWCWTSDDGTLSTFQDHTGDRSDLLCPVTPFDYREIADYAREGPGGYFSIGGVIKALDSEHPKGNAVWSNKGEPEIISSVLPDPKLDRCLLIDWTKQTLRGKSLKRVEVRLSTLRKNEILHDFGHFSDLAKSYAAPGSPGLPFLRRILLLTTQERIVTFDRKDNIHFRRIPPLPTRKLQLLNFPNPFATRGEAWSFTPVLAGGEPPYELKLARAPSGSVIEDGTVQWTPSHSELIKSVSFVVATRDSSGLQLTTPVNLAVVGPPAALAQPFTLNQRHLKRAKDDSKNLWRSALPHRLLSLPQATIMGVGLANNRALAFCGQDQKTIYLVNLRTEQIQLTLEEPTVISSIHGGGGSLLSFDRAAQEMRLRTLKEPSTVRSWKAPADSNLLAVGLGPDARSLVAIDEKNLVYRIDPGSMSTRGSPGDLTSVPGARPTLPPIKLAAYKGAGGKLYTGLRTLPGSSNLKHIFFPTFILRPGPSLQSTKLDWRTRLSDEYPRPGDGAKWFLTGNEARDHEGNVIARFPEKPLPVPGGSHLFYPKSSHVINIIDGKTLSPSITLTELEEWLPAPRTRATRKLTPSDRIFLCPALKKLAILDNTGRNLYIRDLDLDTLTAAFPRQLSKSWVMITKPGEFRYKFDFSHSDQIESFTLEQGQRGIDFDEDKATLTWDVPRGSTTTYQITIEAKLRGGGLVSGMVTLHTKVRD